MNILSPAISKLARMRLWRIQNWVDHPVSSQRQVLQHLITAGEYTAFGKKHNFKDIFSLSQFKDNVPVNSYDELKPYIEKMMEGEENILWNEPIKWFAKSSGTTSDRSKFIPISDESLEDNHFLASKDVLTNYYNFNPESNLLQGKSLVIGGSHQISQLNGDIQYGDLSAVLLQNTPFYGQWIRTPELSIALLDDWEVKIEKLAEATIRENVTSIAGVPTWTLILLKRILEMTGKSVITEVWPELELYLHGGVSFVPYREQFNKVIGKPIHYLEIYNASEGFIAAQDDPGSDGMLLFTEHAIFYEFMPLEEYGKPKPNTLGLDEVEVNQQYAPIITTSGGLWRYLIGDTIQFTSVNPFRVKVSGRLKHFINAFGEELIVDNSDFAISKASEQTGALVNEYTAAPIYFSDGENGAHEWLIEFEHPPARLEEFIESLDAALREANSDYDAKRQKDIALRMPVVHAVPKGKFNDWLRMKGKLGGQHKVPRLSNERIYLDEILAMK